MARRRAQLPARRRSSTSTTSRCWAGRWRRRRSPASTCSARWRWALEALWLLFGPDLKPFQRAVDERRRGEERGEGGPGARRQADGRRCRSASGSGPRRSTSCAARSSATCSTTRRSRRSCSQTELDKLSQLHARFVRLASACARAETLPRRRPTRGISSGRSTVQKNLEKKLTDAAGAGDRARRTSTVLQKRHETIKEIQNFLARARGQMNLIENSVRLLRDQVLTMTEPGSARRAARRSAHRRRGGAGVGEGDRGDLRAHRSGGADQR